MYKNDFFIILEKYNIYKEINENDFEIFLNSNNTLSYALLSAKKIVIRFDKILRNWLLKKENAAEIIIDKYFEENSNIKLPELLTNEDKNIIFFNYINSQKLNINYLEKILYFPPNEIKIDDKVRLAAKRKLQEETNSFFKNNENKIELKTSIKWCETPQERAVTYKYKGIKQECIIDLNWVKENRDYETLLNNYIYIFEIFDLNMILNLVSRNREAGVLEREILISSPNIYNAKFMSFQQKNEMANIQMGSYVEILKNLNIRIESIIEWFFKIYLFKEFEINNYLTEMPTNNSSYIEKCRHTLPEIDKILKQYEYYVKDGVIDQELLQISSTHLLFENCSSLNGKKYIYSKSKKIESIANLFYSDQSEIYLKKCEEEKTFINILINYEIRLEEIEEYDRYKIKFLIEEGFIYEDDKKNLKITNYNKLYILKNLYYKEVISYWHCPLSVRKEIDEMINNGLLEGEKKLLTRQEIAYFNYHLNKSKFSNSLDLRNRYSHGTQTMVTEEHENNYCIFLKLIIIIIVKINDDLCIKFPKNKR